MLKIAYGNADFVEIRKKECFYQDRTHFIPILEAHGTDYPAFFRPRRFGKSLFISMLHCYYGVEYAADFQTLFGDLNIGQNSTPLANQYFILKFDFSGITTTNPDTITHSFLKQVKLGLRNFMTTYSDYFEPSDFAEINREVQPADALLTFLIVATGRNLFKTRKIYVMIDEYDQFTNQLFTYHSRDFEKVVAEDGAVRVFYEVLKSNAGAAGKIDKIYLSGVAPVTLDSMSSGFNISTNISLMLPFHSMLGFEEAEVKALLVKAGLAKSKLAKIVTDLRNWYNGYLFNDEAKQKLYNSTMVLYFVSQYLATGKYPRTFLDPNVVSDYKKIRQIFSLLRQDPLSLPTLHQLINDKQITSALSEFFNLERGFNASDAVSLLFYMGFLTIKGRVLSSYIFKYPNYLIEKLYAQYFIALLNQEDELPIDNNPINGAILELAQNAKPQLFFDQVKAVLKTLSNRDAMQFHEGSLKAIFISLLHHQQFYYIDSEPEDQRRYVDIYLSAQTGYHPNYEIAFELKYFKKKDVIDVDAELASAETQLKRYLTQKRYIYRKNLRGFAIVAQNDELTWKPIVLP